MAHPRMRFAAALLAVLVLAVGCNASGDGSGSTEPARSHPSSATPSAAASDAAHSLTELARQPCRALSQEDTRKLWVGIDGQETDYGGEQSCQWGARGGLVSFTPYPSKDQTALPQFRHLTPRSIGGHRALVGTDGRTKACVMVVAIGASQSFMIMVIPFGEGAPGPDVCTVATNFATAIVSHLR